VPFLPKAGSAGMQSLGVVKAGELEPQQLGIKAVFLPTAVDTPLLGPQSIFPDAQNPRLYLTNVYLGRLGIDDGAPQSVYRLETRDLRLLEKDGKALTATLAPGDTFALPDGSATVSFDGVSRFAAFKVASDPGRWPALVAVVAALAGLLGSLFVRRRRVFVRAVPLADDGSPARTVVEVGALSRTDDDALAGAVDDLVRGLRPPEPDRPAPERATSPDEDDR
jgi:cytochrome c biogenesis protein